MPAHPVLSAQGISKTFPGVQALTAAELDLMPGEVVALLGANGAGKSTLIKILSGVYQPDAGELRLLGRPVTLRSPIEAIAHGISVVHQETSLVPTATVLQNIFLGRERTRRFGLLDEARMRREYEAVRRRFGLDIAADTLVGTLGSAQKKLVEIMKAVSRDCRVLIMDEPTDSLSRHEAEALFEVVRDLRRQGLAIVFITHFLDEVKAVADKVTVLRDGRIVARDLPAILPVREIVALMLGRQVQAAVPRPPRAETEVVLAAEGLGRAREFEAVDFTLRRGEVLGVAGVVGSGKTELARALAGATRLHRGQLRLNGRPLHCRGPHEAVAAGIGMAPEDRKADGLVLSHSIVQNVSLSALGRCSRGGVVDGAREQRLVREATTELRVKHGGLDQQIQFLSGGNQQKCVLARWLLAAPQVLVLDEPTRGIDVGAKDEIFRLVRAMAEAGRSVLYLSGDPDEVLAVADRVIVLQKGRVKARFEQPPSEDLLLKEMIEVTHE